MVTILNNSPPLDPNYATVSLAAYLGVADGKMYPIGLQVCPAMPLDGTHLSVSGCRRRSLHGLGELLHAMGIVHYHNASLSEKRGPQGADPLRRGESDSINHSSFEEEI